MPVFVRSTGTGARRKPVATTHRPVCVLRVAVQVEKSPQNVKLNLKLIIKKMKFSFFIFYLNVNSRNAWLCRVCATSGSILALSSGPCSSTGSKLLKKFNKNYFSNFRKNFPI